MKVELIPVLDHFDYTEVFSLEEKSLPFHRVDEISDEDLIKVIKAHLDKFETEELISEYISPLTGGYILKIDGENKFFPQCCSDVGDFDSWENLSNGKDEYWFGHPMAKVSFDKDSVTMICDDGDENFYPETDKIIVIEKSALKEAVNETRKVLKDFAERLIRIEKQEKLDIKNIHKLLIFGDSE
jgi:hypothetical protein